jgi:SulP family sulfate permease
MQAKPSQSPPPLREPPARIPPSTVRIPPLPPRDRLLPSFFAGAISATLIISFGISLAALIFTGSLVTHLPAGIGIVLASSFIIGAAVSLQSSFRPVIAAPQENTSVVLALVAASVSSQLKPGDNALPTVVAAIAVTSLATGALFLVLGLLKLGKIVRFIPYPVVGGFLAGTGWLLAHGSLSVMTDVTITLDNLSVLTTHKALVVWVPGLCFGVVLTAVLRRYHHFLVLPAFLVAAIGLFFVVIAVAGVGPGDAMRRGWLLGPFPAGDLWPPISPSAIRLVDWHLIRNSAGSIATVTVLAAVSLLLNASGLELATESEVDLDRELRATGIANLVSGALGGVPGYLSLSESTLNHKVGARSRVAGLVSAGLCAVALVAGADALAYFPKAVLGGMLLFLGLSFLLDTVYDAWFRLPRGEYALVLVILIVIVTVGFLEGVGVGVVVSSVLFAVNYARIDIVKRAVSGAEVRSRAGRAVGDESVLQKMGDRVHIFQLQGYIFFGTAYNLLQRFRARLLQGGSHPIHSILIDFRHVDGIDSSAVVSFARMRKLAEAEHVTLILTTPGPSVSRQLRRGGVIDDETTAVCVFPDLDHGLQWCEDQSLAAYVENTPAFEEPEEIERELEALFRHRELLQQLQPYLERVEVAADTLVYRQGDPSPDLYLVEAGELAIWLERDGHGQARRLRTVGAGSVVGEAGVYLGTKRSASVRTTQPCTLLRLSNVALDRMTRKDPQLAATLHRYVATLLAERLVHTTNAAQMLLQ